MPEASDRMHKINEEVKRALAVLIRDVKDPRLAGKMISVTAAEVTRDLSFCTVYVSVLGEYDKKEIMRGFKSASGFLRTGLAHAVRLRATPELRFVLDDHIAYGAHIAEVLNKLGVKSGDDEDAEDGGVS
ncbi:MAG: 30S ribosome-binding factor RbfA [Clostridia bacterium]|nr:30S ribosome-binding factor RbfA [Clostridia bacterium]